MADLQRQRVPVLYVFLKRHWWSFTFMALVLNENANLCLVAFGSLGPSSSSFILFLFFPCEHPSSQPFNPFRAFRVKSFSLMTIQLAVVFIIMVRPKTKNAAGFWCLFFFQKTVVKKGRSHDRNVMWSETLFVFDCCLLLLLQRLSASVSGVKMTSEGRRKEHEDFYTAAAKPRTVALVVAKKMFTYCNVMCTQPTPLFSLVARCWWTTITFGATSWLKLGEQRDPSALKNWHVRSVDHVTLHFFCKHPLLWCWKCAGGEKEVRWRWPMLGHEQQLTSYVKLQICQSVFVYRISCGASSKDHVCQMVCGARLRSLMIFGGLVAFERSVVWNHIQIVAKGPSPESTTVSTSEQAKKAV